MKKLEAEIKKIHSEAAGGKGSSEELVEVEFEKGKTAKVPASVAVIALASKPKEKSEEVKKLEEKVERLTERLQEEERKRLEQRIGSLEEELRNRPSLTEQLESLERIATRLGYRRGGHTSVDVLMTGIEKLDQRAKQLLDKLPPAGAPGFKPEVSYGPEERKRKAEEIERRIEKGKEILEAEDELIKAAAKLK